MQSPKIRVSWDFLEQLGFSLLDVIRVKVTFWRRLVWSATVYSLCLSALAADGVLLRVPLPRVATVPMSVVKIEEAHVQGLLDTAAGYGVMDKSFQARVTPQKRRSWIMMPNGIEKSFDLFVGPSFELQGLQVREPSVVVSDLQGLRRMWGENIQVVVGIRELGRGVISLNYDTNEFAVRSGGWVLEAEKSEEVALTRDVDVPMFAAEIEGQNADMIIDSGTDDAIAIPHRVYKALSEGGVIVEGKVNVRGFGASGMTSNRRGWFTKGRLMGRDLAGMSVREIYGERGFVGLEWLCAFNLEIDMSKRLMRYQQRKNAESPASVQMMLGATLLFDESGATVERLRPGRGAAEEAGLEAGDILESLGGLDSTSINDVKVRELVTQNAGKSVPFRARKKSNGQKIDGQMKFPRKIAAWDFAGREFLK